MIIRSAGPTVLTVPTDALESSGPPWQFTQRPFVWNSKQPAQLPRGHRRCAHGVADLDGEGADRRHSELHRQRAAGVINDSAVKTYAHHASIAVVKGVCHFLVGEVRQRIKPDDGQRIGLNSRGQLNGVALFIVVADQRVRLLLLHVFIERSLVGDQCALIHLDRNSPEEREVVFHLAIVVCAGGAGFKRGGIDIGHRAAIGGGADVA